MKFLGALFSATILAAGATPVVALQGQTAAGAQQFLRQVLPGARYRQWNLEHDAPTRVLSGVNSPSECVTHWTLTAPATARYNAVFDPPSPAWKPWGDLEKVDAEQSAVLLHWRGNGAASRLYLNSDEMAVRVAYAIDFLRIHCDPTAGTGF